MTGSTRSAGDEVKELGRWLAAVVRSLVRPQTVLGGCLEPAPRSHGQATFSGGHADLRQDADRCALSSSRFRPLSALLVPTPSSGRQDGHARGGAIGLDRECEGEDPGQGGHPSRPAAPYLCGEAARGWAHPIRLQHPEG